MKALSIQTKSVLLLSFLECWERFSYYGMRALLILYLTSKLGFSDAKAYAIYAIFGAIGYIIPILAGYIADRYVGFQKVLILGGATMCIGHIAMAFSSDDEFLINIGLAAIAVGTGFFKGNITNLLGSLFANNDDEREKSFSWFYVAVNLGGAVSAIACGAVAREFGWQYGFGLAGIGMFIGLIVFMSYRALLGNHGMYPGNPILKNKQFAGLSLLIRGIALVGAIIAAATFALHFQEDTASYVSYLGVIAFIALVRVTTKCTVKENLDILALFILSVFFLAFFAVEMQLGSLINLFTERNVDRMFFGYEIPSATLQSINPVAIIVLGIFLAKMFSNLGSKFSMARFMLGLFVNVSCFLCIYIGCLDSINGKVHISYLIAGIALMGVAEILISPLLLSLFTVLSPVKIKGFMMGVLMFGLSYANLAGILIGKYVAVEGDDVGDAVASLAVYEKGFYHIMILSAGFVILFAIIFPFLHGRVVRKDVQNNAIDSVV